MSEEQAKRTRRQASEAYVDELIAPGMGARHSRFLARLGNPKLAETMHDYHLLEAQTEQLSIEENYLVGMAVLYATRSHGTAGMFAKTLLHRGVEADKLREVMVRLSMWIGGIPAAEAAGKLEAAILDYEARGLDSMSPWFPAEEREGER